MKVRVLVLTERLDGLARTMRDLDAQALPYADFGVTYVARGLRGNDSAKLEELESRRPNVTVSTVPAGGDWSQAVASSMDSDAADHVLAIPLGAGLLPEALPRLVALAETGRAVVVARQIGRPAWERIDGTGPVTGLLVNSGVVASVAPPSGAGTARDWIAAWHDAVLAGTTDAVVLDDYPVFRPSPDAVPANQVRVHSAEAAWHGNLLNVQAVVGTTSPKVDPVLVLRGPEDLEYPVATELEGREGTVHLSGEIDVQTSASGRPLPPGEWTVGVMATQPGYLAEGYLPKTRLLDALVGGRPVVPTRRGDKLRLQVGAVRRNYFHADPATAQIVETARGTRLTLPLDNLHVADTTSVAGSLFLGRLKVPASVEVVDGRPTLQAWLSGLARSYPVSVDFGHVRPVKAGLKLVVDGAGQMSLMRAAVPKPKQRPSQVGSGNVSKAAPRGGSLARVRAALPAPVRSALSRVPGLKSWYAARTG